MGQEHIFICVFKLFFTGRYLIAKNILSKFLDLSIWKNDLIKTPSFTQKCKAKYVLKF